MVRTRHLDPISVKEVIEIGILEVLELYFIHFAVCASIKDTTTLAELDSLSNVATCFGHGQGLAIENYQATIVFGASENDFNFLLGEDHQVDAVGLGQTSLAPAGI
jgi:hypothetical protein